MYSYIYAARSRLLHFYLPLPALSSSRSLCSPLLLWFLDLEVHSGEYALSCWTNLRTLCLLHGRQCFFTDWPLHAVLPGFLWEIHLPPHQKFRWSHRHSLHLHHHSKISHWTSHLYLAQSSIQNGFLRDNQRTRNNGQYQEDIWLLLQNKEIIPNHDLFEESERRRSERIPWSNLYSLLWRHERGNWNIYQA